MEGRELRRLRLAHGLTVSELASMVNASEEEIYGWEAPTGAVHSLPMSSATRQQIIRQLALYRDKEEMERLPSPPRLVPQGFRPGQLIPSPVRIR